MDANAAPLPSAGDDERYINGIRSRIRLRRITPVEIAQAMLRTLELPGYDEGSLIDRRARVAARYGKCERWLRMQLAILELPGEVQVLFGPETPSAKRLKIGIGQALFRLGDQERQIEIARQASEHAWSLQTVLSRVGSLLAEGTRPRSHRVGRKLSVRVPDGSEPTRDVLVQLAGAIDKVLDLPRAEFETMVAGLSPSRSTSLLAKVRRGIEGLKQLEQAFERVRDT